MHQEVILENVSSNGVSMHIVYLLLLAHGNDVMSYGSTLDTGLELN